MCCSFCIAWHVTNNDSVLCQHVSFAMSLFASTDVLKCSETIWALNLVETSLVLDTSGGHRSHSASSSDKLENLCWLVFFYISLFKPVWYVILVESLNKICCSSIKSSKHLMM